MTREENIQKQQELEAELKLLRRDVQKMDYDKNYAESKKYVGRYFIEVENGHQNNWKRIIYVWGVDEKSAGLDSISFNYYEGQDDYFGIEDRSFFSPIPNPDDLYPRKYEEITEEEFVRHYKELLARINKIITIKL